MRGASNASGEVLDSKVDSSELGSGMDAVSPAGSGVVGDVVAGAPDDVGSCTGSDVRGACAGSEANSGSGSGESLGSATGSGIDPGAGSSAR